MNQIMNNSRIPQGVLDKMRLKVTESMPKPQEPGGNEPNLDPGGGHGDYYPNGNPGPGPRDNNERPPGTVVDDRLWNGIRPPDGPEYQGAMDSWKESIGKPMQPGEPRGSRGSSNRASDGSSHDTGSLRRAVPHKRTLLSGGG